MEEVSGEGSLVGLHRLTFRGRDRTQGLTLSGLQRLSSVVFWSQCRGAGRSRDGSKCPCMGKSLGKFR